MKKYCRISPRKLGVLSFLNFIGAMLTVALAVMIQNTVDGAQQGDGRQLQVILAGTLLLGLLYFTSNYLKNYYTQKVSDDYVRNLRNELYEKILRRNYGDFRKQAMTSYLSLLTNDVNMYQEGTVKSKLLILQNGISLCVITAALLYIHPGLTLLIALLSLGIYFFPRLMGKKLSQLQLKVSHLLSALTEYGESHLEGFYVLYTYGCQAKSLEGFQQMNQSYNLEKIRLDGAMGGSEALSGTLSVLSELMVMLAAAALVLAGHMTGGTMVAIMQLTGQFVMPLMAIMQNIPRIEGGKGLEKRFLEILEYQQQEGGQQISNAQERGAYEISPQESREPERTKRELRHPQPVFSKNILLNNLRFSYQEGREVLRGISFTLEKNKKYVLIGKSGCGKSTLLNVLNGIYNTYEGEIKIDGEDRKNWQNEDYVNLFATVGQNVFLFPGTLEENIVLMEEEKDEERLAYALEVSGTKDILAGLEEGIHTRIRDNGANLSGGQKQKIALARAIYHRKPVLLFDEGTSAIDKKTGAEIESRLLKEKNITLLTITHDIHSGLLEKYDQILYLDKGQLNPVISETMY